MSVIVVPLYIELYGSQATFDEAGFRRNILTQVNQIWSQAQIRFELRPIIPLTNEETSSRLGNRLFHVNELRPEVYDYEPAQLQGIARGQPSNGIRICITHEWNRTMTVNGVQRPSNLGNTEGVLAVALGAGNFGIRGLERTIVARPPAAFNPFLLSHEIGHLLIGAGHPGPRGHLMAGTSSTVYTRLTDDQIVRAQQTARRIPGHRIQN